MLSGSFRVDTNKLACQTCLLRVTRVDPYDTFLIISLSGRPIYDPNLLRPNPNPKKPMLGSCRVRGLGGRNFYPLIRPKACSKGFTSLQGIGGREAYKKAPTLNKLRSSTNCLFEMAWTNPTKNPLLDRAWGYSSLTLCLFQHYCFLENISFFGKYFPENYFPENYLIFRCLVTTLRMSVRIFSGVWYAIFLFIFLI